MDDVQVSVIVPTYGEAENLPVIVPQVAAALAGAGLRGEIIVVDDNSPDETPQVCAQLATEYPLRLLVRTNERGLSSAVIHGIRNARGSRLLVMDADLSHPPEKVPELFEALNNGADFVIGSRYVAGGGTDENWGLLRWLNSKAATLMALPLTSAKDPMAGFFALRKETFDRADHLDPIGYKIGLELIVKCDCRNVQEVPIAFRDRLHGESKLTLKEQVNYLRHLKRLYEYRLGRLSRPFWFVLVGASGMVVDLGSFLLLMTQIPAVGARAIAIWLAMTWNFAFNRRLTYSDVPRDSVLRRYALFCGSCMLGFGINLGVWWVLVRWFEITTKPGHAAAAFCGIVAGTVSNYLLSTYVAFRK
jgi:dolichol-phosphate mannosyltransferase